MRSEVRHPLLRIAILASPLKPHRVRSLVPAEAEVKDVHIERCECTRVYKKIEEVQGVDERVYMRPQNLRQATVDSIRQPGDLYQVTCAEEHAIKLQGLKEAVAVMRDRAKVTLYFVVPDDRFDKFQVKDLTRFLTARGYDASIGSVRVSVLEVRYEQV